MFGRPINLPVHLLLGIPEPANNQSGDKSEYATKLREKIDKTHAFARENIKLESNRQKRNYDHSARSRQFNRGDPVWLHNPVIKKGKSPKLQRIWQDPYLVVTCLDDLVYRIQQGPSDKAKRCAH